MAVTVFENDDLRVVCESKGTNWGRTLVGLVSALAEPEDPDSTAIVKAVPIKERAACAAMVNAIALRCRDIAAGMQVGMQVKESSPPGGDGPDGYTLPDGTVMTGP